MMEEVWTAGVDQVPGGLEVVISRRTGKVREPVVAAHLTDGDPWTGLPMLLAAYGVSRVLIDPLPDRQAAENFQRANPSIVRFADNAGAHNASSLDNLALSYEVPDPEPPAQFIDFIMTDDGRLIARGLVQPGQVLPKKMSFEALFEGGEVLEQAGGARMIESARIVPLDAVYDRQVAGGVPTASGSWFVRLQDLSADPPGSVSP